jgi:hypothetical protein
MAFPTRPPIKPWSQEAVHWNGTLVVTRGLNEAQEFYRDIALKSGDYFLETLGAELGQRALNLFQWALCVYGEGDHSGKVSPALPCPDAEVAAVLRQMHGRWYLPTLCVDADGVISQWASGPEDKEEVAFLLSLVGCAGMLYACDNSPIELRVSTRRKQKEAQVLVPWPAAIIEDSAWKTAKTGNCYAEYNRTVKFERVLEPAEVDAFKTKWWATERSPGWADPLITSDDNQTFLLRTAVDSSD